MFSGKKCTYGLKCKFYHPERLNQSQLSVADELRALGDRAKSLSPAAYHQEHSCTSTTPPPVSREEPPPRDPFICHRVQTPQYHLSSEGDEAFGSMDGSMSRLYIQDGSYGAEPPLTSYSSGLGSYLVSGSHAGGSLRVCQSGPAYYSHQSGSCDCRCAHQRVRMPASHQHPAWSSCPPVPPYNRDPFTHFTDRQPFGPPPHRQTQSQDPWSQGGPPDTHLSRQTKSLSLDQRRDLRSQLSTLFPQSMVERVLEDHPHTSDRLELIQLLQSYRSSSFSF